MQSPIDEFFSFLWENTVIIQVMKVMQLLVLSLLFYKKYMQYGNMNKELLLCCC